MWACNVRELIVTGLVRASSFSGTALHSAVLFERAVWESSTRSELSREPERANVVLSFAGHVSRFRKPQLARRQRCLGERLNLALLPLLFQCLSFERVHM